MTASRHLQHDARWLQHWKHGFYFDLRIRPVGILVACAYAAAFWLAREASWDQFYLPAGVRVAALVVCRPQWWPYLLVGEYACFGVLRYPLAEQYGWAWVVFGSSLLMPVTMLSVYAFWRLSTRGQDGWIIPLAGVSAVMVTAMNLSMAYLLWPSPPPNPIGIDTALFVLGDFVGILTVAPLGLLWMKRHELSYSLHSHSATCISLVALATLGVASLYVPSDSCPVRGSALLLMGAPAIALTCMHGWLGAAISVPTWSVVARFTFPSYDSAAVFDHAALSLHQTIVIAGASLLAVGARLSRREYQLQKREADSMRALSHTRSAFISAEQDMRTRALEIRQLEESFDASLCSVAEGLRVDGHEALAGGLLKVTTLHSRKVREQVTMVYPTSLEHVGLYLALQIGGIDEAWKATERLAPHRLTGDPCRLSVGLQLAAYRTIIDAVSLLLDREPGQIQIRARCGASADIRGIVVSVAIQDPHHSLSSETLAAAIERLTGRPLAYGGTIQCRRNRIRILLLEQADTDADSKAVAARRRSAQR